MRKRIKPPAGFVDTIDAARIVGLSVKSLGVYRSQPGFEKYGPPFHMFDKTPIYSLVELREWVAARAEKAKAKAERLERVAIAADDPRFDWLDQIEIAEGGAS